MSGPAELRIEFGKGLGGGVLVVGPSSSESLGSPKTRSLASYYFATRSTGVSGTGEEEAEGVVVGVGCSSILIGAWVAVGRGGGMTVAEIGNLETTSRDIGVPVSQLAFQNPHLREDGRRVSWNGMAHAFSQIFRLFVSSSPSLSH